MAIEMSIIIPSYRREGILIDAIRHLLEQRSDSVEVIVVDQTEQHSQQVVERLKTLHCEKDIHWIRRSSPGVTRAMNCGVEQASGDLLLFLDDDIIPDRGLFAAHLRAHRSTLGDLIAGRVLQPWHDDTHNSHPFTCTEGGYRREFMGGNFSIRHDLLIELGGFDENFKGAAYRFECEFADRLLAAGHRIWYEPTALIRHLHHASGGTRSKGDHLTSWNPRHPVGAYYYLFVSPRVCRRTTRALRRLVRSVMTRHHLRKPWYIPVTLTSEVLGLFWALWLRLKGPALPFRATRAVDQSA